MSDGRTSWWSKDADWFNRERVVALGEEFGPVGPLVLDWLSCAAKRQHDGGYVKAGYRAIARGCFTDVDTVRAVVSRSVTLAALDEFSEAEHVFVCRISGWKADQERAQAATRKARSRSAKGATSGESRSATERHAEAATGQDSSSSSAPARAREGGPLLEEIREAQEILESVAGRTDASEIELANLRERLPSRPFLPTIRGAAQYLAGKSDRPTMMTLHRFFEIEPETAPGGGRSKAQRDADDLAALGRLAEGGAA